MVLSTDTSQNIAITLKVMLRSEEVSLGNPATQEAEAAGLLWTQGQASLQKVFLN